jgi:aerobic-type carbon monoxide dehydrogenase small subunit (CoxS/CutS family)
MLKSARRLFGRIKGLGRTPTINVRVNGREVAAFEGDTIAGLLFSLDTLTFRRSFNMKSPRSYYCGMGICWECTVHVDGRSGVRACLTEVKEGMQIETDRGHDQI